MLFVIIYLRAARWLLSCLINAKYQHYWDGNGGPLIQSV